MNFGQMLVTALGFVSAAEAGPYKPLPRKTALEATNMLNGYRRSVGSSNMQQVEYDFEAQAKLDAIVEANPPRWFFENYTGSEPRLWQGINGYYVAEQLGYPGGFDQITWHDTCKRLGVDCIITNFKFRAAQLHKGCLNFSNCDDFKPYARYQTCKTAKNETGPSKPCSYAWDYMPKMLTANVNRMACAVLEQPGWKPPPGSHQLNSYWCFTNGKGITDKPFEQGKACGECEPQQHCKQRLCV